MALGKKKHVASKPSSNSNLVGTGGLALGLEFLKYKRGPEKKRVSFSNNKLRVSANICKKKTVSKRRELETLPQDILVRIICGVEHEDLKQLFKVSKTIREATMIAKKRHFEYTTPRKTLFFRGGVDSMIDLGDDIEAPLLRKCRFSRIICDKKVSKISIALFK